MGWTLEIAHTVAFGFVKGQIWRAPRVLCALASTCSFVELLFEWTSGSSGALTLASVGVEVLAFRTCLHPGTHTATSVDIKSLVFRASQFVITHALTFVEVELVIWRTLLFEADTSTCVDVIVLTMRASWPLRRANA